MKILLINDYIYKFGGAEEMLFETKNILEENGHTVRMLGVQSDSHLPPLLNGWISIDFYSKTNDLIKNFHPNIIHVHGCMRRISPSPLIAAKKNSIPTIMTLHDFDIFGPKVSLIKKNIKLIREIKLKFQRYYIRKNTDYYIGPSRLICGLVEKYFGTKNVFYIPNYTELKKSTRLKDTNINLKHFTFIGRLSKEKGVDIAIQAIDRMIKMYKLQDVQLNIIGEGKEKDTLINLVRSLKIQKNVIFLGKIPNKELDKYYIESTAIVIPSTYMENSPLVAYEAMKNRKPIIGSNVGGIPDLVMHKKNGFLFKMGDVNSLCSYMRKLYDNKPLAQKMGAYGFEKVSGKYTKKAYYRNLLNAYNKVINNS